MSFRFHSQTIWVFGFYPQTILIKITLITIKFKEHSKVFITASELNKRKINVNI